jgi:hypothetical protein
MPTGLELILGGVLCLEVGALTFTLALLRASAHADRHDWAATGIFISRRTRPTAE